MAGSIAKAYVQIIPSAEGIKGKLSNVFNGEMPSAGQSAGGIFGSNLVGKIKGFIAAAGLGKTIADAIMTGSDLEQLKGGVQKIFDEMDTSTIMADAANAYKDLNMSANQYLAVINDVGAAFAATMGDEKGYLVAKTGLQAISDYASGTGKNVDVLSEKFTMITRSTSSYQSIADQFSGILPATSAGFLEQAQAAGILSSQYKSLTEVPIDEYQQAVSEMLAKGTAELGLAGNTAAETATTLAGSLAAMKSAYSNFLGALATGEDIGPSLEVLGETVFTFVSGNLLPMVGNLLSGLPEVISGAFSMAIQGLNMVADNADNILQQGIDLITGIGSAIITALPYLAEAALSIISSLGEAIVSTDWAQVGQDTMNSLRNDLDLAAGEILGTDGNIVQSVLDAIATGLPDLLETGGIMVNQLVDGVFEALPGLVDSALELVVSFINKLVEGLPEILNTGKDILLNVVDGIRQAYPDILESAGDAVASLISGLVENLPDILDAGFDLIVSLIEGIGDARTDIIAAAGEVAEKLWDTIKDVDWLQLGKDIINGLINGIGEMGGALWDAAQNTARSALNAIKNFFGIASPSKVMRDEIGKQIPAGIAVGIETNTQPLSEAMHDLSDMATNSIGAELKLDAARTVAAPQAKVPGNFSFTINVYGAVGQSVDELAEILMQRMQFEIAKMEAKLA